MAAGARALRSDTFSAMTTAPAIPSYTLKLSSSFPSKVSDEIRSSSAAH
jgi:hypothetical protein